MGNILQCPLVGITTIPNATTSYRSDLDRDIARKSCRTKAAAHCREKVKLQLHPPIRAIKSRATFSLDRDTEWTHSCSSIGKKKYDSKAFLPAWIIPTASLHTELYMPKF